MRILVVCGAGTLFGKEMVTLSLLRGLRDRGHQVTCITSTWKDGKFEKRLQELSIPSISLPLGFISKTLSWSAAAMTLAQMWKLPSLWFGYRKAIRSYRPDVVLHSSFHHVVLLWPFLGRGIDVFHVHDAFAPTYFYRQLFKMLSRRIRVFVGVSKYVADSLRGLGVAESKITYVLNGVETNGIALRQAGKKVTDAARLFRIGIVGQIAEGKGHEDLVDALRVLQNERYPFVCRIFGVGSPEFASRLASRIKAHKLADKVEWMGYVHDGDSIYGSLDICVVPSRFPEAFGMVAAEAGLHGLPVVATRAGGLQEIVVNEQTGYLVESESPEELAEKIGLLLSSPERQIGMGRNAAAHVLSKLSVASMTEKMEAICASILAEQRIRKETI